MVDYYASLVIINVRDSNAHKNVLLTKIVCRVLWFANSLALLAEISKMSIMQKAFKLYTSTSCKTTLATAHTQSIKM